MSVVAITSSRTSPGATSLAAGLAIAWSHAAENALLVEADPAGGVLALRFDMAPSPSLATFGSDVRNGFASEHVWKNTQDLRGVHCIPSPVDPRLARSWIERVAPTLVSELPKLGTPAVIDLGWVDEDGASAPVAAAADITLVVTSADTAEVQGLLFQVRRLQAEGANVALVTVGDSPNDPQEIAAIAGVPLAAVLPHDPAVAAALAGGKFKPNKFRRSLLWRTISGLAESLLDAELMANRAEDVQHPAPVGTPMYSADGAAVAQPDVADTPPAPVPGAPAAPVPVPAPAAESSTGAVPIVVATYTPPAPTTTPVAVAPPPGHEDIDPGLFDDTKRLPQHSVADLTPGHEDIDPGLFDDTKRLPHRGIANLTLATGERHELDLAAAAIIGRHRDCAVTLDDNQVSRRHGRITRTTEGWHYADLGSRNGTRVNGEPCTDASLTSGDVLTIGRTHITFQTTSIREMECA